MRAPFRTSVFVLLTAISFTLAVPAMGHAQETSLTETPVTDVNATPTNAPIVNSTETSPSPQDDAEIPSVETDGMSRLLIKISPGARLINVMTRMSEHGHVITNEELGKLGIFILEVPADQVDQKISELQNASGVGWVEPDFPVQALETTPNDPSFASQYALTAIHAPQGWDISTGSSAVTIAILDSGVDMNHPDLAGKIVQGYDFVNNDANPQDDYGHGTHVAGIAAASSNNGIGIAGASWGANIMPVKVLNATGAGSFINVASGVVWATDHGAQIINLSLGGPNFSQTMEDAISYAASHGVFMAAASGNSNANIVLYPARSTQVMAVAATDASNQRAAFSNYGPEVEIAAPGEGILSLWPGGGYNTISGTSMATPYVSGLAAILFGYANNAALVRTYLKDSALDIAPAGFDIYTGAGLIQMDAALQWVLPVSPPATAGQNPVSGFPPPFSNLLVLQTQTSLATFTAIPVTSTLSTATAASRNPSITPSPHMENTDIPAVKALDQDRDFGSSLFCLGLFFIVLGMLVLYFFRKRPVNR